MIRARFVGQDNSMGFKHGDIYCIKTRVASRFLSTEGVLVVYDCHSDLYCPYSRLETFLDNWILLKDE